MGLHSRRATLRDEPTTTKQSHTSPGVVNNKSSPPYSSCLDLPTRKLCRIAVTSELFIRQRVSSNSLLDKSSTKGQRGAGRFGGTMCIQFVERYSICRCISQVFGIDECPLHQRKGHAIQEHVIEVGVLCQRCFYSRLIADVSKCESDRS